MHRISSSGQDPNPDTVNINFDQYPSWKYQNHNFSEFSTLYNKIKSAIGSTPTVKEYTSITETIIGKNVFKTEKLYNALKKRLEEYIKYINKWLLLSRLRPTEKRPRCHRKKPTNRKGERIYSGASRTRRSTGRTSSTD